MTITIPPGTLGAEAMARSLRAIRSTAVDTAGDPDGMQIVLGTTPLEVALDPEDMPGLFLAAVVLAVEAGVIIESYEPDGRITVVEAVEHVVSRRTRVWSGDVADSCRCRVCVEERRRLGLDPDGSQDIWSAPS